MTKQAPLIKIFWQAFSDHRHEFETLDSADDPTYLLLLEHLEALSPDLYFEFLSSSGANEFIITADGERSLFPLVEEIVAAAPASPDWTFFALKPEFGFPESTEWEGANIQISEVRCQLVDCPDTKELGLRLAVPRFDRRNEDSLHNALLRAIDHGVGERRFAETIEFTELTDSSAVKGETFPLADLAEHLPDREPTA
jgi:hypothetical protein